MEWRMDETLRRKILEISDILDKAAPPHIAFLEATDPFKLLISVILSAQTTDRQVNIVAQELFSTYPDPHALAKASIDDVKAIIKSTGYYNAKAKNIIGCAAALEARYEGVVPDTMEDLTTLPGVGRKTANCILGGIYGRPAIIVDTHFGRVVRRLGLVSSDDPTKIEHQIAALLPPERHYRFSMTVNWFGRIRCHAKAPECGTCMLAHVCPWEGKTTAVS
jgi:endonuclease-3